MEIIQQLQRDRTQIVHVFDDLVRKLPKGVSLTSLSKRSRNITLQGLAQSNARVSNLMRNLDDSDWFTNPRLAVVNTQPSAGTRVSKFTVRISEEKQTKKSASADDEKEGGQS